MEKVLKYLTVFAHGVDRNSFEVVSDEGDAFDLTRQTHGYVPHGLCLGGGDDTEFKVDIETGKIVGWDAEKVKARIREMISEFEPEDTE